MSTHRPRQPDRAMVMDQLNWDQVDDRHLNFLKAVGVECVRIQMPARFADGQDHTAEFARIRRFVEERGILLLALHGGVPTDDIVYGRPGRERQLSAWIAVVRALGAAGVAMTGLTFQPIGHFRTERQRGRGGALLSTFDIEEFRRLPRQGPWVNGPQDFTGRELGEEALWESATWFFSRIVPVAEDAGVRIALHPDDPPIPDPLGGAARIVTSMENYDRIYALAPSPANAMLFCQGCVAEMGVDVYAAIADASSKGRICYVHFRDIVGTPHNFREVFVDEGQTDMAKALRAYRDNGFAGPFMMDHTPTMPDGFDTWHGHAYGNGYIKALIQSVYGRS
jgi:mannonate dehydratase